MRSIMMMVVCLAMVGSARADLVLYAQQDGVNGGAITEIASGSDFSAASFTGVYGDFTLTLNGTASHNTATLSSLLGSTVSLMNNSGSTETITLYASQNNYTLPVGTPLNVESSLSGTVNVGDLTGSGVFTAFASNTNNLLALDFSNGAQDVVFDGSSFDTGSATGTFNRTGSNTLYSLTTQIVATVSAGGEGTFSWHENVTAAVVPEPSTILSALVGMMTIGGYAARRRLVS